ncbi:MAG TPA: TIGR01212 family radical SAM protein [bacterium]|nr:TIGR01212 family radical SAM protein [bacterium]
MINLYNDLNTHLRERFGERVQRIPIDAGFSCPNRDGTIGTGGCIYCSPRGSAAGMADRLLSVTEQLERGMDAARARYRAKRFIAYFQAFTNTYLNSKFKIKNLKLEDIYQPALEHPDVVGLAVGTRPDCLPDETIELFAEIAKTKLVWLELGLQSSHDQTLQLINRGHKYAQFIHTVHKITNYQLSITNNLQTGLEIVVHVIFGLPGETKEMMLETIRRLASLGINGIKIHLLHVVQGTELERQYQLGKIPLLKQEEYVGLVCDALELLPEHVVIHRLTGEASPVKLVAPDWACDKQAVLQNIQSELVRRGTRQASKFTQ